MNDSKERKGFKKNIFKNTVDLMEICHVRIYFFILLCFVIHFYLFEPSRISILYIIWAKSVTSRKADKLNFMMNVKPVCILYTYIYRFIYELSLHEEGRK